MRLRGRRITVIAAFVALALVAPFIWREAAAIYYLQCLRSGRTPLRELLEAPDGSGRGQVLRRFLGEPDGAGQLVEQLLQLYTAEQSEWSVPAMVQVPLGGRAPSSTAENFVTFLDGAVEAGDAWVPPWGCAVNWLLVRPAESELWSAGSSVGAALPVRLYGVFSLEAKAELERIGRWLPCAAGIEGRLSADRAGAFAVRPLCEVEPARVVVVVVGDSG